MTAVKETESTTVMVEDKEKDTKEFMELLKVMKPAEVNTVKGIMIGIKMSRQTV